MENQVAANADAEKILGFHHRRKFLPPFQNLMIPAESGLSNPRKKPGGWRRRVIFAALGFSN
jgi:hypothetical protein